MNILLVHNNPHIRWADVFRAEEFKKQWTEDEVDVVSAENLPDGSMYDVIHFLYSGGITRVKDYILKHKEKVFTSLASERTLEFRWDSKEDLLEIYKNTRCCVCQNRKLLEKFYELTGQDNAVYIPNGVDENLFNRKFVVGHVGTKDSAEHKGLYLVRQACKELGLELKEAHEHNYAHEEMPNFYHQIDCLVIPSMSEGCNNPTMEALAMNKLVISTKVGIANELQAITYVERDVESIKTALRVVSGRIQILENYTWKIIASAYHKLYE